MSESVSFIDACSRSLLPVSSTSVLQHTRKALCFQIAVRFMHLDLGHHFNVHMLYLSVIIKASLSFPVLSSKDPPSQPSCQDSTTVCEGFVTVNE